MKRVLMAGVLVLGAAAFTGCGAQPGKTEMTYNSLSKEAPGLTTVHSAGKYALYPSDGTNPIVTKDLQSGDQYGFVKNAEGKVQGAVVVNGQQENFALTSKLATAYYWKLEKK